MSDGIDQRLAYGEAGIFGLFLALEADHHRPHPHLFPDDVPRCFEQAGEWPLQFGASAIAGQSIFATRLGTHKAHEDDATLGQELLRPFSEEEQARHGRRAIGGQRPDTDQMIIHRATDRPPPPFGPLLEILLDDVVVQVRAGGPPDWFSFEVTAGLGGSQLADRIAA